MMIKLYIKIILSYLLNFLLYIYRMDNKKRYKYSTIRKNNAIKVRKIFGGFECSSINTSRERRVCNNNLKNLLDIQKKHTKCNLINNNIQLKDIIINFQNQIGKGFFGTAYLSTIKYKNDIYDVIIKEQIIDSEERNKKIENELSIIKYLSLLLEKKVSPHFLYYYTEILCNNMIGGLERKRPILDMSLIKPIEISKRYFIVEKATGALSSLKYDLKNHFNSIISQIILSIFTFHQYTRCYHLDTHHNNFLYNEIKEIKNTFIKYKLDNNIYKLKLSKYLIILWDYGISESMISKNFLHIESIIDNYWTNLMYDYFRIISIISDDKLYENNKENYIILKNIILSLKEYNTKIKNTIKIIKNKNKQIDIMLQIEKEFIYSLIQRKLLINNHYIGNIDYYNSIPYELQNNGNYNIIRFENDISNKLNDNFEENISVSSDKLIKKLEYNISISL